MPTAPLQRVLSIWRSLTPNRRVAAVITVLYALAAGFEAAGLRVPGIGLLRFLFSWALFIWFLMLFGWIRRHLLWSLRNRLMVAYVFIAVVPILLLLAMAAISASILYAQLGSYVLTEEVNRTLGRLKDLAESLAAVPGNPGSAESTAINSSSAAKLALDLPGLEIRAGAGEDLLPEAGQGGDRSFAGLVQRGDQLWMRAVACHAVGGRDRVVMVTVPVAPELLDSFSLELGLIRWDLVRRELPAERGKAGIRITVGSGLDTWSYIPVRGISSRRRVLPPKAHWLDQEIIGYSNLEAVDLSAPAGHRERLPVFASFYARPSRLNRVLFSSLGDLSSLPFVILMTAGALFLAIEVGALITGAVMTRTITRSVDQLYKATQRVKAGDFSHRIREVREDQLGSLAASFNEMTVSVARSIEEQRERERLQNELAIAREVQNQLFPRTIPRVPGFHLVASCRAARVVSGDYYDFISLGADELAIIVADIAGKGISAALLMANLQAALRSQLLDGVQVASTAGVVARLNRQLVATAPEDRFATMFLAIYNAQSRLLRYTNAGHLPPLCVTDSGVTQLEVGGTIVGMFPNCEYEEGSVTLEPGSVLAAYSDGITEPENAYGEQFGRQRLIEVLQRSRSQKPEEVLTAVLGAVDQWAGTPEQADDMTVVIAAVQ